MCVKKSVIVSCAGMNTHTSLLKGQRVYRAQDSNWNDKKGFINYEYTELLQSLNVRRNMRAVKEKLEKLNLLVSYLLNGSAVSVLHNVATFAAPAEFV